jgi:LysM repeat protein
LVPSTSTSVAPPSPNSGPTATSTPTRFPLPFPGCVIYHTVSSGDTLASIAQYYGTSVDAIKAANRLENDSVVVGQRLCIPDISVPTSPTPMLTPTSVVYSAPTPLPKIAIEAEWWNRMEVNRSDTIRVSLVQATGRTLATTIEVAGRTMVVATPIPYGTPSTPIEGAFGPQYEAVAIAKLHATAFEVEPVVEEEQSLEQPRITWKWNIFPKSAGRQIVNVHIIVRWKPKQGGQPVEYQIWESRLEIRVMEPLIAIGQLNLLTLLSGFLGTGLSIPWIYKQIQEQTIEHPKRKKIPKC